MNKRITMTDVAKRAGVHPTAVSLALRNHPSLPVSTRQRLQQLANDMGYQRDPALSALSAYRRQIQPQKNQPILAYITNWETRWGWKDKDHPAHLEFFEGATNKATSLGFQLEHFWLGEPGLTHRRLSHILYTRGITGLILASHRREIATPVDFDWAKFSGVKIDCSPKDQVLHMITNDQRTMISLAMQRMRAAGYRRIGCVMPYWWDEFVDLSWSAGFLTEQQRLNPAERIPILFYSSPQPGGSLQVSGPDFLVPGELLTDWMQQHKPEVIVSYGPFVKPRLATLGISIPKDIAYVETFLERTDGHTAGIQQNCHRVGEMAVEILVGQLHQYAFGLPKIATSTLVEGTWFDGSSLPPRIPARAVVAPENTRSESSGKTGSRSGRKTAQPTR